MQNQNIFSFCSGLWEHGKIKNKNREHTCIFKTQLQTKYKQNAPKYFL